MNQCIVISGPCEGVVIKTQPELPFELNLRLPMKAKPSYIPLGEDNSSKQEILYINHKLITFKGNIAYYAPEGMSSFDVITNLLN